MRWFMALNQIYPALGYGALCAMRLMVITLPYMTDPESADLLELLVGMDMHISF